MCIGSGCCDTRKAPRKKSVYVDVHQRVLHENEKSRWRAHKEQETEKERKGERQGRTEEEREIGCEGGEQERTGERRGVGTQRSVSTAAAINNVRPKRRDA